MNFENQVRSNCRELPFERVVISRFDQLKLAYIERAIVFVFSTWSALAVMSFQFLCATMAKTSTKKLPLIVLNADEIDLDAFEKSLGELPQGKGEAFWVKNGRVVQRDHGYTQQTTETLQRRIQDFEIDINEH